MEINPEKDFPDWMDGEWDYQTADEWNWKENVPGLVGRVTNWILSQAQHPQPEMSIGAALCLVSVLKAHKVRTETDLRTNIMIANIAPSGSGKNWPLEAIKKILEALNVSQGMLLGEPASDSGLLANLRLCQDKGLLIWDEFGDALKQLTSASAGTYQREILATTKKLFSSASSVYTGKAYSDGSQRQQLILKQPCLSVLGASTPERLYSALSSNLVEDGFLSRFLFIEPEQPEVEEFRVVRTAPPSELVFQLNQLLRLPTNAELPLGSTVFESLEIKPRVVKLSDKAQILATQYSKYYKDQIKAYAEDGEVMRAIWARGMEHTLKISLVVSDGEEIDVQELFWAFEFVTSCIDSLISKFFGRVAESERERKILKVLNIIKEHHKKHGEIPKKELTRKTQSLSNSEREDYLDSLIESEEIYSRQVKADGARKSTTVYGICG